GRRLLTRAAGPKNSAMLWDAATGEALLTVGSVIPDSTQYQRERFHFIPRTVFRGATFSEDGRRLVVFTQDGKAAHSAAGIWDSASGKEVGKAVVLEGTIVLCRLSPTGNRLLTADPKEVRLWDLETGKVLASPLAVPAGEKVHAESRFTADGHRLVLAFTGTRPGRS